MKNTLTFNFYSDGSHGWIKVKKSLLVELGIERYITSYSHMKGEYAYLEEDCDALILFNALRDKGVTMKTRDCSGTGERRSPIRNYESYEFFTTEETERLELIRAKMFAMGRWNVKGVKKINKAGKRELEYWNEHYKMGL